MTREFRRIGVNLNQIAKRINQGADPATYDEIKRTREELKDIRKQLFAFIDDES